MNAPSSVFVLGNYAYVASSTGDSLAIIDITNKTSPDGIGQITKADPQISTMNSPESVFVVGNHAYVASSSGDSLAVIEIS